MRRPTGSAWQAGRYHRGCGVNCRDSIGAMAAPRAAAPAPAARTTRPIPTRPIRPVRPAVARLHPPLHPRVQPPRPQTPPTPNPPQPPPTPPPQPPTPPPGPRTKRPTPTPGPVRARRRSRDWRSGHRRSRHRRSGHRRSGHRRSRHWRSGHWRSRHWHPGRRPPAGLPGRPAGRLSIIRLQRRPRFARRPRQRHRAVERHQARAAAGRIVLPGRRPVGVRPYTVSAAGPIRGDKRERAVEPRDGHAADGARTRRADPVGRGDAARGLASHLFRQRPSCWPRPKQWGQTAGTRRSRASEPAESRRGSRSTVTSEQRRRRCSGPTRARAL